MGPDWIFRDGILKGKVALVTGGATGIGNGIARRLARAGADVVVASRTAEKCVAAADVLQKEFGVRSLGLGLDVRHSAQVNEAFKDAAAKMGGIDILINNAAGNFYWPAEKLRDKLWLAVLEIDLHGTFYCSRAAFKYLKARGGGSIISISSNLQKDGWIGMAPATSAKGGIDALTKTLALEWAPHNIRVNAIAPGPIVTEGVSKAFEMGTDFSEETWKKAVPLQRTGLAEEVGDLAVFMCSPAASWMTGTNVPFDGGEAISPLRAMPSVEQLHAAMNSRRNRDA
ncbi:MAG: SDR family oxidoreductase [Leptospirales bacterium]|nr:SDR family oxidoreductase [Leptospirales bacterium]